MKKLKHCDLINSKYSLRESRKDHVNKLDFKNQNSQSTSNLSRQINGSNSSRRTKCVHRENSTSSKNMYKLGKFIQKSLHNALMLTNSYLTTKNTRVNNYFQ